MQMNRSKRMMIGTVCLVIVALVMGWFVGRYIPGEPSTPEPTPFHNITEGSGLPTYTINDTLPHATLRLRDITQGVAYETGADTISSTSVELLKRYGNWEYTCPDIDVSVSEIRTIPVESFAEWYPAYQSAFERPYNNSVLVAVTLSIENASDERISRLDHLPKFTLWNDNIAYIENVMGSGIYMDAAFYFANTMLKNLDDSTESLSSGEGAYIDLEPGESQTLVLPFRVNKTNLIDQSAFEDLNPSDFCLQTSDFASNTTYRLWL
ncbi:hypothetical protein [Eggerthella sinensis]|uniref:hypothetical protein n=1 Tax=Eggerthella sinensis TaxID=242230 RepID=UPI0022E76D78|nr:hypothetical protein [Eggerthella sinensis]